ncbi:MAG: hypothetical protein GEU75_04140 [Dehalococcoidia bacterium]|nr:hypothetical protein [Dehalococcoidia bacterium]
MNDGLLDAFRHSAWANKELIGFCRQLTPEQLKAETLGVYGSVIETLKHLLGSEAYYSFVIGGSLPDWEWWDDEPPSLVAMEKSAAEMAAFWETALSRPFDAEAVLIRQHEDGAVREARAGIVLAQALHHANVHREQICTIVTTLGIEPPDLDVWSYGIITGRHSLRRKSNAS